MIHQSQAGCVIGKAGSKLKEFRHDMGVDIKVFSECCPRSTERVILIAGKQENVSKCVVSILVMLKTVSHSERSFNCLNLFGIKNKPLSSMYSDHVPATCPALFLIFADHKMNFKKKIFLFYAKFKFCLSFC